MRAPSVGGTCGCFGEGGTEGGRKKRERKKKEREEGGSEKKRRYEEVGREEQEAEAGGGRCVWDERGVRFHLPGEAVLMTGKCEIWRV